MKKIIISSLATYALMSCFALKAAWSAEAKITPKKNTDPITILEAFNYAKFEYDQQQYQRVFRDLLLYAHSNQIENLFIPKFGLIKASSFFDALQEALKEFLISYKIEIKILLLSFEPQVKEIFGEKLLNLSQGNGVDLVPYFVHQQQNIEDVIVSLKHENSKTFWHNTAIFSTVFSTLSGLIEKACQSEPADILNIAKMLVSEKFSNEQNSFVGSTLFPCVTRSLALHLAPQEQLLTSCPVLDCRPEGLIITEAHRVDITFAAYIPAANIVSWNDLLPFLKNINFPENIQSVPTPIALILNTSGLKTDDEKNMALAEALNCTIEDAASKLKAYEIEHFGR